MKKFACALPTNPAYRGPAGAWEPNLVTTEEDEGLVTEDGFVIEVEEA